MISDIEKTIFHDYFHVFLNDDIISNILYFENAFLNFTFNLKKWNAGASLFSLAKSN